MRRVLMIVLMALMMWGCASESTVPAPVTPAPAVETTDPLRGEWVLYAMNGETLTESVVSLEFTDGQIAGMSFCNNYSSTITVSGDAFTVDSAIVATKMFCPEGNAMDREQAYFVALGTVTSYAVVDGRLTLRDASQTPVLVYQR